jgi:hypothetical protein
VISIAVVMMKVVMSWYGCWVAEVVADLVM